MKIDAGSLVTISSNWRFDMTRIKTVISVVLSLLLIAVFSTMSIAAHDDIPRISIEELKALLDQNEDVTILDAQIRDIYNKGHIKGARSFPWKANVNDEDIKDLPKDKLTVTYCDCGPGETDSSDLAAQLLDLGLSNVKILKDPSIRGWKKAGYPLE